MPGFGEELLGLSQVLLVGLEAWVPAEGHGVDAGGHAVAEAVEHELDDGVVVDGEVGRLPHATVGEGIGAAARCLVELQHGCSQDGRGAGVRLPRLVDDVHLIRRHRLDDVHAAREQLGDLGGLLGDDPDAQILEGGLGAPVVVVTDELVLLLAVPPHQLVGAGADRVLLHPLVALFPDDLV